MAQAVEIGHSRRRNYSYQEPTQGFRSKNPFTSSLAQGIHNSRTPGIQSIDDVALPYPSNSLNRQLSRPLIPYRQGSLFPSASVPHLSYGTPVPSQFAPYVPFAPFPHPIDEYYPPLPAPFVPAQHQEVPRRHSYTSNAAPVIPPLPPTTQWYRTPESHYVADQTSEIGQGLEAGRSRPQHPHRNAVSEPSHSPRRRPSLDLSSSNRAYSRHGTSKLSQHRYLTQQDDGGIHNQAGDGVGHNPIGGGTHAGAGQFPAPGVVVWNHNTNTLPSHHRLETISEVSDSSSERSHSGGSIPRPSPRDPDSPVSSVPCIPIPPLPIDVPSLPSPTNSCPTPISRTRIHQHNRPSMSSGKLPITQSDSHTPASHSVPSVLSSSYGYYIPPTAELDSESKYVPQHPFLPSHLSIHESPTSAHSQTEEESVKLRDYVTIFLTDTLPRQIYLHFLLRLPYLYFSRVDKIFKDADLTLEEIKEMALQASVEDNKAPGNDGLSMGPYYYYPDATNLCPAYHRLKTEWENFIDNLMREWKTLNLISVLLLSAIMTVFQIQGASEDPVTRYIAFWSLICALLSLLCGCLFIIRFAGMRKAYKAAEWALEARNSQTILWNVWVMLAMPVIWLAWSIITYVVCIMSFMWRVSANPPSDHVFSVPPSTELGFRIFICTILATGIVYGILIINTFRRYGTKMDEAWRRRVGSYVMNDDPNIVYPIPPPQYIPVPSPRPSEPVSEKSSETSITPIFGATLALRTIVNDSAPYPDRSSDIPPSALFSQSPHQPDLPMTRSPSPSQEPKYSSRQVQQYSSIHEQWEGTPPDRNLASHKPLSRTTSGTSRPISLRPIQRSSSIGRDLNEQRGHPDRWKNPPSRSHQETRPPERTPPSPLSFSLADLPGSGFVQAQLTQLPQDDIHIATPITQNLMKTNVDSETASRSAPQRTKNPPESSGDQRFDTTFTKSVPN